MTITAIAIKRFVVLVLIALAALPGERIVAQDAPVRTVMTGSAFVYAARAGDTLRTISARFGVSTSAIVPLGPARSGPLVEGEWFLIDNRHIAVLDGDARIVINIAQRMLYLVDGTALAWYPIAVGTRKWPTPVGAFTVLDKEDNPTWDVPLSIQEEMRQQGRRIVRQVPPSPQNPLGAHWIRLSFASLGIHGTNVAASIYSYASHGCIRMHPDDVAQLYERVGVGTAGVITYQPVLIAMIDDRVYVEAHPDVYRRAPSPMAYVRGVAERTGFAKLVDWVAVAGILRQQSGVAIDVTKDSMTPALGAHMHGEVSADSAVRRARSLTTSDVIFRLAAQSATPVCHFEQRRFGPRIMVSSTVPHCFSPTDGNGSNGLVRRP